MDGGSLERHLLTSEHTLAEEGLHKSISFPEPIFSTTSPKMPQQKALAVKSGQKHSLNDSQRDQRLKFPVRSKPPKRSPLDERTHFSQKFAASPPTADFEREILIMVSGKTITGLEMPCESVEAARIEPSRWSQMTEHEASTILAALNSQCHIPDNLKEVGYVLDSSLDPAEKEKSRKCKRCKGMPVEHRAETSLHGRLNICRQRNGKS